MPRELVFFTGLSMAEEVLLESYLDLVELADGRTFGVTDVLENAQVELFDPNTAASTNKKSHKVPRIAYVAPTYERASTSENVRILRKPVSLGNLRDVLSTLAKPSNAKVSLVSGALPSANDSCATQDPKQASEHRKLETWLTLLTKVERERFPREIQGLCPVQIMLFPMQKTVSISDPQAWRARVMSSNRSLIVLPHVNQHVPNDATTFTFDRFRWELCMMLSDGVLLSGIADMARYSLIQWPDFGVLGASAQHMKLSALLHARELSITQTAALSKLPVNTVIAFINGCAGLGLIKNCPRELLGRKLQMPVREVARVNMIARPSVNSSGFGLWIGKIRHAFGLHH